MHKYLKLVPLFYLVLSLFSCQTGETVTKTSDVTDSGYLNGFPRDDVSKQLENITASVKKIDCLAFYMTYVFSEESSINKESLPLINLKEAAVTSAITNESVSATATLVYSDGNILGMLTNAHVVDFPDTVFRWMDDEKTILHSVSVKLRQQNSVAGIPHGEAIEIVAMDTKNDIAFLRKIMSSHYEKVPVLSPEGAGEADDLNWGTFVYIIGYPLGNLMLTNAIVSNPDKTKGGYFQTNAIYNRGISGSPVFAIRRGNSEFEWVGMASSAPADNIIFLKPDVSQSGSFNSEQPYEGELYIDQNTRINYGVTSSVTIDAIREFLRANKETLEEAGIYFNL